VGPLGRRVLARLGPAGLLCLAVGSAGCSVGPASADPAGSTPLGTGSQSVAAPFVGQVHVSISDTGCSPQALNLPAGPTTFIVTNSGSASVLEYEIEQGGRIIGEVENVVPGIDRSFTLNLKPGAYNLNCPGGTSAPTGTLTVTE
jgi:iron uptake system EfeUOB component EfeO/EfeM